MLQTLCMEDFQSLGLRVSVWRQLQAFFGFKGVGQCRSLGFQSGLKGSLGLGCSVGIYIFWLGVSGTIGFTE